MGVWLDWRYWFYGWWYTPSSHLTSTGRHRQTDKYIFLQDIISIYLIWDSSVCYFNSSVIFPWSIALTSCLNSASLLGFVVWWIEECWIFELILNCFCLFKGFVHAYLFPRTHDCSIFVHDWKRAFHAVWLVLGWYCLINVCTTGKMSKGVINHIIKKWIVV